MISRLVRFFAAFCLVASLARSADTVELLPGRITGTVQLSSESVTSGSVYASATDGSGSASTSFTGDTFSIVVPAGKTWKLNFGLALANAGNNYSQISINTAETIAVGANETVTQNYSITTARVTGDVQVANGTLSSFGYVQASGSSGSGANTVSFYAYAYSTGVVTVLPFNGVSVYGTANLLSTTGQTSTVPLPSTTVDVPAGGATVSWSVDAAFVSSTIQGALTLTGGPAISSAQVYFYGPDGSNAGTSLTGNGSFQFDNLKVGAYSGYAYVNFPNTSLYLYRTASVAAGAVTTVNFTNDLATANIGLQLTGFLTPAQLSYANVSGSGPDNASGYASLNSAGSFAPVVTTGNWSFAQLSLGVSDANGSLSISSYDNARANAPVAFAAGDNLTVPAFSLNTTQTEFTFDVVEAPGAAGETLISYPSLSGYTYKYSPTGEYLGYSSFSAQSYATNQAKPRVLLVGEPGTYQIQAYGNVEGTNVSFGSFSIELKAPLPTPVGTNVTVSPGAGTTLVFDAVTTAGVTTASQLPVGPALPGGYSNLTSNGQKVYYSASTTAVFTGYIEVTVGYDPATVPADLASRLRLFYYDKATEQWIDITTGVDEAGNQVTGVAPALSTFALGLPHAPVLGAITVPAGALKDTALPFSATFTDSDPGEAHTASWFWGDGSGNTAGTVTGGTISGEHTFSTAGTFTGTLTLTDITGNVVTKTFTVTVGGGVTDTTAPVITLGGNLTAEATSASGAAVNFTATATDATDGTVAVTTTAASGAVFPLGTTTVTATATDAAGNVATKTFTVTVVDTTKPVLALPANLTVEATSGAGAVATFAATATDATGATLTYSVASGSTFPVGTTTVTATATDAAGNVSTGTFTVTVRDATAPVFTALSTNSPTLWPPNHKLVAVTVSAAATDAVGPVTYRILTVTSSEPDNGLGDGDTANDIQITGALTVNLRAERSGKGTGRTYTITVEAKDAAGNVTTQTVTVTVPKDQSDQSDKSDKKDDDKKDDDKKDDKKKDDKKKDDKKDDGKKDDGKKDDKKKGGG
ncbi:MAG: HYR domain-containing protein [Opitutae bacterium]|nr:HYR domain-containing protein [Opitutae bacterium]